jgi:hypothetical protein
LIVAQKVAGVRVSTPKTLEPKPIKDSCRLRAPSVNQELVAVAEQSDVRHQSDVLRHRAGCLPRILLAYRIGDLSMTFQ